MRLPWNGFQIWKSVTSLYYKKDKLFPIFKNWPFRVSSFSHIFRLPLKAFYIPLRQRITFWTFILNNFLSFIIQPLVLFRIPRLVITIFFPSNFESLLEYLSHARQTCPQNNWTTFIRAEVEWFRAFAHINVEYYLSHNTVVVMFVIIHTQ